MPFDAALDGLRGVIMGRTGAWLERRLGGTVLAGGIAGALDQARPGSSQGLRDLAQVRGWLSSPGPYSLMDSPWVPLFVAVVFLLHPTLGWIALGGAVLLAILALFSELLTRGATVRGGAAQMEAIGRADAALRNADVVEAMCMTPALVARWRARHEERPSSYDLWTYAAKQPLVREEALREAAKYLPLKTG
jgi:ABC-type protease/lipase transport system fused ATPase/permease subunit